MPGETTKMTVRYDEPSIGRCRSDGFGVRVISRQQGENDHDFWQELQAMHLACLGLRRLTHHDNEKLADTGRGIRRIRERGYALDDEEFVIGMKCVAAPIWSESGEPIGSLSVSGLAARVTPENIEDVAKHVMAAAKELTDIIGGHPS
jgi:DNA-binding IclR family transcriptional regulator